SIWPPMPPPTLPVTIWSWMAAGRPGNAMPLCWAQQAAPGLWFEEGQNSGKAANVCLGVVRRRSDGTARNQLCREEAMLSRRCLALDLGQQHLDGGFAQPMQGLMDRRQGRLADSGGSDIVEAYHRHLLRHAHPRLPQGAQHAERDQVIAAEDGGRAQPGRLLEKQAGVLVAGFCAVLAGKDQRLVIGDPPGCERLPVSARSLRDASKAARALKHRDPPVALLQQMLNERIGPCHVIYLDTRSLHFPPEIVYDDERHAAPRQRRQNVALGRRREQQQAVAASIAVDRQA